MALLFTIGNVFTAQLLIIQSGVILISSSIGFIIACCVSFKSSSMYRAYQRYSNQGLGIIDIIKISTKDIAIQFKFINFIKGITYIILNLILFIICYRIWGDNLSSLKWSIGILANIFFILILYYFFWKVPSKAYKVIDINNKIVFLGVLVFTYILYGNIKTIIFYHLF